MAKIGKSQVERKKKLVGICVSTPNHIGCGTKTSEIEGSIIIGGTI